MYGVPDRPRTVQEQAADDAFVERVAKDFGGREQASMDWVDQGFRFYQQGDLTTAMRRFNQAWLLNPANPEVFWGFASSFTIEDVLVTPRR
jgi:thioredoxin-like negative regulator of GroEL